MILLIVTFKISWFEHLHLMEYNWPKGTWSGRDFDPIIMFKAL